VTELQISLMLFAAAACYLYAYGTAVMNKMGETLHELEGGQRARPLSPFGHADLVRRYAALWEASEARLPRLHRSIRLNRVLLVLVVVGGIVRALLG